MGWPPVSEMNALEPVSCRSCGLELKARTVEEQILKGERWAVASFQHNDYPISLIVCPRCAQLQPETVLSRYKERVSSGQDLNFH